MDNETAFALMDCRTDAIALSLPGLTTCSKYLNASRNCSDIPEWFLDARPESVVAGIFCPR